MARRLRGAAAVVLAAACGLAAACSAEESTSGAATPTDEPPRQQVRPGVTATVVAPRGGAADVVVVLVPGGGWVSADPSGLAPLAAYLADRGATVVSITYRTSADRVYFPEPVQDVGCGVAFAAAQVPAASDGDVALAVVGHSAGAQLAAVAALDPALASGRDCPFLRRDADLLVGLAGPYDVVAAAGQAQLLFGPESTDPAQWDAGNPLELAANRPEMPVLLVHGGADDLVPVAFSQAFADALTAGGHDVVLDEVDGVDHTTVYGADVAGPIIAEWLNLAAPSEQELSSG